MQVNGFHNEAFEGESQDIDKGAAEKVDLTKPSPPPNHHQPPPEHRQNGTVSSTALNGHRTKDVSNNNTNSSNHKNVSSSSKKTSAKNKKQKQTDIPVVFLGGRNIEVRHESQDYVKTSGIDNPAYEGDGGQRSPMHGLYGDDKGNEYDDGDECCCSGCKCVLIVLLVFILLALVAVAIVFLFLPKTRKYYILHFVYNRPNIKILVIGLIS